MSSDLQDLIASVKAVERDPFKYGLDTAEVGRRRRLVQERGIEVDNIITDLKKVLTEDTPTNGSHLPIPSSFEPDTPDVRDEYAAFEQQRQVEIMQDQDEALDDVFRTMGNLKQQADDMGREFEEQDEMLEEVGNAGDRLDGKLKRGIKQVEWVIKRNEGKISRYRWKYTWLNDSQTSCQAAA